MNWWEPSEILTLEVWKPLFSVLWLVFLRSLLYDPGGLGRTDSLARERLHTFTLPVRRRDGTSHRL
jgi:hypothetical protein